MHHVSISEIQGLQPMIGNHSQSKLSNTGLVFLSWKQCYKILPFIASLVAKKMEVNEVLQRGDF